MIKPIVKGFDAWNLEVVKVWSIGLMWSLLGGWLRSGWRPMVASEEWMEVFFLRKSRKMHGGICISVKFSLPKMMGIFPSWSRQKGSLGCYLFKGRGSLLNGEQRPRKGWNLGSTLGGSVSWRNFFQHFRGAGFGGFLSCWFTKIQREKRVRTPNISRDY